MRIGVFDSGVGGLTVVREIEKYVPCADIIYVADSKHVPYGTKTKEELKGYVKNIISFLIEEKVDVVVFACNTATSLLLDEMKQQFDIPMIGVIEAGVEMALQCAKKGIGVIATTNTIESKGYEKSIKEKRRDIIVKGFACNRLVRLIEEQVSTGIYDESLIACELQPLEKEEIDVLILGCTHFPLVEKEIAKITNNHYTLINPAIQVARRIAKQSAWHPEGSGERKFYTSGDEENVSNQMSAIRRKKTDVHMFLHEEKASNY